MESTLASSKGTTNAVGKWFRRNLQTSMIIILMIVIWIFFSFLTKGAFIKAQNVSNLFRQMTVTSILAVGMVLVIVTGGIDLAVGKFAGFVSVIVAYLQAFVWYKLIPDQPFLAATLSVIAGLAVGILVGMLEGYIISYLGVPAFITTLGFQWIWNGAILLVTGGRTIPANQPFFSYIAQGYLPPWLGWAVAGISVLGIFYTMFNSRIQKRRYGFSTNKLSLDLARAIALSLVIIIYVFMVNRYNGVQVPVLIMVIVGFVMAYLGTNTPFGRHAYALGGNMEAARLSGINIKKNVFLIFVLMGLLCGVAGIVLASYVGYGTISAGQGYELDAIASCILGGTSPLGGSGTVFGALIGSLIMASLTNGLQLLNVTPAWQYMVKGAILVGAVYIDVYFKKNR
ncbi:MAG: sugar ABC transporter permease [Chloroflexi bacterium]|jgi:D-xylose transport system permease protein|nr:sugar ABC transporter permease [Chloroflexota bacterium]BCY16746.1 xylose ABC transporter permease [Leptolinea sp. HRD-7]